jgi:hypothetical protein
MSACGRLFCSGRDTTAHISFALLFAAFILSAAGSLFGSSIKLADDGIVVDSGAGDPLTLTFPTLLDAKQSPAAKIVEKRIAGNKATLRYDNGAVLEITAARDGSATLAFSSVPDSVHSIQETTNLSIAYGNGGTFKFGKGVETPFPQDKPAKPHIFQGNASEVSFKNPEGKTIHLSIPPYTYCDLQDNREWNWAIYQMKMITPFDRNIAAYKFSTSAVAPAAPILLADQFGQSARRDYPTRVKSLEELKADVAADKAYYASLTPPAFDKYGGLPDSGEKLGLNKTGFFHVQKAGGRWILVDPAGNAFFHLGICAFGAGDATVVRGREDSYAWLPENKGEFKAAYNWDGSALSFYIANWIRKFDKPYSANDLAAMLIERARKWGFNSAGAFGGKQKAYDAAFFPYVAHLPLASWEGLPQIPGVTGTFDPFDEANRARVDKNMAAVAAEANDPLIIGYYITNEPLYEDLPRVIPGLNSKHAVKRRLVQFLKEKYATIDAFNAAWNLKAASFDALADAGLAVSTKTAADDIHAFTGIFFDEYFKLISTAYRKYDPNHMLIGNRLQPGTINNEQLVTISSKFLDVLSFNYYTTYFDRDFLDRIDKWAGGKPMFLSEFYWSSSSDSGLSGGRDVASQKERGLAYRNYVEAAAATGYVVGIEWFQLTDQPVTGRSFEGFHGESGNTGLLDVTDRPWKAMLGEMMKTNYAIYDVEFGKKPAFKFDDPRFSQAGVADNTAVIPRAPGAIKLDGTANGWPGIPPEQISSKRLAIGASDGGVQASFKLCHDDHNLYVLVDVTDPTPMKNNHTGGDIWNGDAVELFTGAENPDQGGPLQFKDRQILLSAGTVNGKHPTHIAGSQTPFECPNVVIPRSDGKGYILEAAIPLSAVSLARDKQATIRFDIAIDDDDSGNGRTRQLIWNGNARNSTDRSAWGHATFLP